MITSKTYCPKCGCASFHIYEDYVDTYIYFVNDGSRKVEPMGMDNDGGEHIRTTCICANCGYRWHPRKLEYSIDNEWDNYNGF